MYLDLFFTNHSVFTTAEITSFLRENGTTSVATRNSLLQYHEATGRLLRVRRGLYAVVPVGVSSEAAPVDPYLVAAKAAPDAVLGYHAALAFHGKAYSLYQRFEFLTAKTGREFQFRGDSFRPVRFPKALEEREKHLLGVTEAERSGLAVRVTSLERTLVDVLDRPALGGGWEEIWRSLESREFFDLDRLIEYAILLGNATTVSKVGFYLEQHREALMVDSAHLKRLQARRPKEPHYLEARDRRTNAKRRPVAFLSNWNLIVPQELVERSWEAVS
jgi:predicted transcriptional regulator of viral defense system